MSRYVRGATGHVIVRMDAGYTVIVGAEVAPAIRLSASEIVRTVSRPTASGRTRPHRRPSDTCPSETYGLLRSGQPRPMKRKLRFGIS
jgi:hypothetical protein